jgi:hypothetical protein
MRTRQAKPVVKPLENQYSALVAIRADANALVTAPETAAGSAPGPAS